MDPSVHIGVNCKRGRDSVVGKPNNCVEVGDAEGAGYVALVEVAVLERWADVPSVEAMQGCVAAPHVLTWTTNKVSARQGKGCGKEVEWVVNTCMCGHAEVLAQDI